MPTVLTNDIETYYERRGTGPPVVFVHGAIVDHSQWEPQADALADEYTTIVYDVRGHGRTGGSAVDAYSMDLFADDLHALLTALDIERPVLCGLSTGGCIAQVYAARHPDAVAGLVLADTFTPDILTLGEWFQRRLLRATVLPVRLVGYRRVEKALVRLQEFLSGSAVSGDYENIERLRADSPPMTTDEFAKVVRAVAGFSATAFEPATIRAPALVIYGEHDVPFVRRHGPKLALELPTVTVRDVPEAGHAANLDNPAFVTRLLREFVHDVYAHVASE